jgi:hypothetical protein
MALDDLLEALRRRPFVPFRLTLTEGSTYEVRHPELCMPGRRSVVIGIPAPDRELVYDRYVVADLFHVVKLEPLDAAPSPNGQSN